METKIIELSECCNAESKSACNDKQPHRGSTWWNYCTKCLNQCNIRQTCLTKQYDK